MLNSCPYHQDNHTMHFLMLCLLSQLIDKFDSVTVDDKNANIIAFVSLDYFFKLSVNE